MSVPPRIYVIVAASAPVAAVFRRGPSHWWHIGKWDLLSGSYEPGAWLRGGLYPRRCDLSPDGKLLLTYVRHGTDVGFLEPNARPPDTYITVSKLPWLHALAAWREGSTWGRGYHFARSQGTSGHCVLGAPESGNIGKALGRYDIERYPTIQYAVERQRGWVDHADSPPRHEGGPWDEHRNAILVKRPGKAPGELVLTDRGSHMPSPKVEGRAPSFTLHTSFGTVALDEAAWADWAPNGRLAVATASGVIEISDTSVPELTTLHAHDLSKFSPNPQPAPAWAQRW
jgi:hypothetical protein